MKPGERSRRVDFFGWVASLQRRAPKAARIGHLGPRGLHGAAPEALRIRPHLSLDFPARDVEDARWTDAGGQPRIELDVNFGGLYGPDSPLPNVFTEELLEGDHAAADEDVEGVRAFLDIFHHRLYSLLFRAWERNRWFARFERDGTDDVAQFVFALAGLGTDGLPEAATAGGALPRLAGLRYAALRAMRPRSAGVLRAAARDLVGARVRVEPFVLRLRDVAETDRTYLGGARLGGRRVPPRRLGRDALVGRRVPDRGSAARVVVGPLDRERFDALQPGAPLRLALDALLAQLAPEHVDLEIVLILAAGERVRTTLGPGGARLGRDAWVTAEDTRAEDRSVAPRALARR